MFDKRFYLFASILIGIPVIIGMLAFVWSNFRGARPAFGPPVGDIAAEIALQNETNPPPFPLELPTGFRIDVLAKVENARDLAIDPDGNVWVSQPKLGHVSMIDASTGNTQPVYTNLHNPHGIAFDPSEPNRLYIAEETQLSRTLINADGPLEKIADLPAGGRHTSRTLAFGSKNELYVSVGSTCDVCLEKDARNGSVLVMKKEGSNPRMFATGLRNAVFLTWSPYGGLWGTEMGRDRLGDNLPPDELNTIQDGKFYGWPYCYGQNIQDTAFDASNRARGICQEAEPAHIEIPAHSAPLGLAFIPESWPEEYRGDLLVAYHGSWNRSVPTGYKIERFDLDETGELTSESDFVNGWLTDAGALGRPVDLDFDQSGTLYVSDDKAGLVYKISYEPAN